jgi:hypothetical protein
MDMERATEIVMAQELSKQSSSTLAIARGLSLAPSRCCNLASNLSLGGWSVAHAH